MRQQSNTKRTTNETPQETAPIGLPAAISSSFGQAYNYNFGDVQIFPEQSNLESQQMAVAQGNELRFAPGAYQPQTDAGRWLIGHELFHVAQQHSSAPSAPNAVLEHEADFAASAALDGRQVQPAFGVAGQQSLAFEAWEHRALGDAQGGSSITVTTNSGVTLTYGQMVALSGDFYRSPNDLMNAPRAELEGILRVMAQEQRQVDASIDGRPTDAQIAGNNSDYEDATNGSRTAHHHDHASDGDEHADGHGDHDGHEHDGMNDPESNGPAGGASPDSDATFIELADNNASHFSPENIRDNFIPKHTWALQHAREVWQLRNPNQPAPAPISMGGLPSARAGTADAATGNPIAPTATSSTPTTATPAPNTASPPSTAPAAATPNASTPAAPNASTPTASQDPAQLESQVWMVDAFSNHFLTDAFAGGHLISGNVGRTAGSTFLSSHTGGLMNAFAGAIAQDHPTMDPPDVALAASGLLGVTHVKGGSLFLKVAHDALNQEGVQVRNARGDLWNSMGDSRLADSPETRRFGELASRLSRESIQDVLNTGTTTRGNEALDYIPDAANFRGGAFEPILSFSANPTVFNTLFEEKTLNASNKNAIYQMIKGNLGLVPAMARTAANRYLVNPVRNAWNSVSSWVGDRVDDAQRLGRRALDVGQGVASDVADRARRAVRAVGNGVNTAVNWVADGAINLYQGARRLAAGGVARALEPGNPTADANATTPASQTTSTTPLQHQTYAHGAFMGAGVAMMNDSHWQQIFATVMPEAYARARNLTEPEAVMAELENNPVLAAYGQSQSLAQSGASAPSADHPSVAMEWDVWLPQDPAQITDLNRTRIAHGNLGTTVGQRVAGDQEFGRQRADVANAPGADQWMTYFGRAIALHRAGDAAQHDPQGQADLEQATQLGDTSAATRIAASYLRSPSGLYLDVKSTYSTPDDINAFIAVLRNQGINVIGVGSFNANQLQGLDANVRPIQFFHGISDLRLAVQNAPDQSQAFQNGDSVMFNAGSLLTESRAFIVAGERSYTVDAEALGYVRTLQAQFGLRVGLYVQETSVDPKAVEQIVQLVNANPGLFSLGFAYGNLSDRAEGTVTGRGLGAQAIPERIAKFRL